jgi:hypothetical protein
MRAKLATLGLCLLTSVVTFAGAAYADDAYAVSTSKGHIEVTPKGPWHINKDYPWKLQAGSNKIDKSKFQLSDTKASLDGAPSGAATLKGAVCNGDQCKTFSENVTVP